MWVLGGGPDGSSSLHVVLFRMFFQRSMSLPFRVGVTFLGGKGPCGSRGSACELPRPHDDVDADDDDDDDDDDD